jgi:hypothetical protein
MGVLYEFLSFTCLVWLLVGVTAFLDWWTGAKRHCLPSAAPRQGTRPLDADRIPSLPQDRAA